MDLIMIASTLVTSTLHASPKRLDRARDQDHRDV